MCHGTNKQVVTQLGSLYDVLLALSFRAVPFKFCFYQKANFIVMPMNSQMKASLYFLLAGLLTSWNSCVTCDLKDLKLLFYENCFLHFLLIKLNGTPYLLNK